MDDERRRRGKETYDLAVGFFGFFAAAFVVVTVFLEVTGKDAVWASATALVTIAVVVLVWLFRRRFLARAASEDEP